MNAVTWIGGEGLVSHLRSFWIFETCAQIEVEVGFCGTKDKHSLKAAEGRFNLLQGRRV